MAPLAKDPGHYLRATLTNALSSSQPTHLPELLQAEYPGIRKHLK